MDTDNSLFPARWRLARFFYSPARLRLANYGVIVNTFEFNLICEQILYILLIFFPARLRLANYEVIVNTFEFNLICEQIL